MTTNDILLFESTLINVAQLLDGWHCDTAWTEYDTSVRSQVTDCLRLIEAIKKEDELNSVREAASRKTNS